MRATALVLASLFALPNLASAAVVQKWATGPAGNYRLLSRAGDINQDGVYDLVTGEKVSGNIRIALRSGATGALLAQTANTYSPYFVMIQNILGSEDAEIIFLDNLTGKLNCLQYNGTSTLIVRWSFLPAAAGPFVPLFVDFDGNGVLYLVFMDANEENFFVYNANGVQVAAFSTFGPPGFGSTHLYVDDYDGDGRQEFLIDYRILTKVGEYIGDEVYVYESGAPVAVEPGATESPSIVLGPSSPNPTFNLTRIEYSLPITGPASLRLFDVKGREVRTLVDGVVEAGRHQATWDGRDGNGRVVPAGQYFYQLNAGGQLASRRVIQLP